jgi:AcrR family transcriptional regulator
LSPGAGRRTRKQEETETPKRSKRLTAEQRREQLLTVARDVFADHGFAAASVEEIAERAGVSKPVVYEHFEGKDGVYAVVVEREIRELVGRIKTALQPGDPRATIIAAVDTFMRYIEEQPQGFTILVRDAPVGSGATLPSVLDEISRAVEKLLAGELTDRGYDKAMAPVLARSLVGMIAVPGQWWIKARRPRRQQMADQIVNLAWNGLSRLDGQRRT